MIIDSAPTLAPAGLWAMQGLALPPTGCCKKTIRGPLELKMVHEVDRWKRRVFPRSTGIASGDAALYPQPANLESGGHSWGQVRARDADGENEETGRGAISWLISMA